MTKKKRTYSKPELFNVLESTTPEERNLRHTDRDAWRALIRDRIIEHRRKA